MFFGIINLFTLTRQQIKAKMAATLFEMRPGEAPPPLFLCIGHKEGCAAVHLVLPATNCETLGPSGKKKKKKKCNYHFCLGAVSRFIVLSSLQLPLASPSPGFPKLLITALSNVCCWFMAFQKQSKPTKLVRGKKTCSFFFPHSDYWSWHWWHFSSLLSAAEIWERCEDWRVWKRRGGGPSGHRDYAGARIWVRRFCHPSFKSAHEAFCQGPGYVIWP